MNLKERFSGICSLFTNDLKLTENLWAEIEKKYAEKGRHYHNLGHLDNMSTELENVRNKITCFTSVSFSIFYHDAIYNSTSKSNEEKSAEFAIKHLQKLGTDLRFREKVSEQILATKLHERSHDNDINYLLDADLSILGAGPDDYLAYTQKIRKEYSIYPDLLYKPGRKKVLQHFLDSESIFKTNYFIENYEVQARKNIRAEIESLHF